MYLSIIGSSGCGKTTLFRAFSGITAGAGNSGSNIAIVEVPDERLDKLTGIFNPRKTVYGRIEVSDMPGIKEGDMKNESVPAKLLQQMRQSDAFLLVLRNFDDSAPVDPVRDFHTMLSELVISDIGQIENRLERIKKQAGKKENTALEQEKALMEQCLAHLEDGKPLRSLPLSDGDRKSLRSFQFLSQKPLMIVVNCAENMMGQGKVIAAGIKDKLSEGVPVVAVCARLEAELSSMDPEDQALFMEEYGLRESLRGRLIRLAYQTLGLISFLTVGDDECRAWPIRSGISAQEAAGVIHTDLSDKFIRAETVAYEDFITHGDFAACKKAGVWRLEGKQYIVKDGDILSIRGGN
ncbi:MAG: Ribosome-binding ATPase YchF [Syntrophorhabdaceae bacterium PtaU1.Bin034]|nr:MAG: Ribosome-binding ATPase YchF [Syntrophorhabdaceae bacterium PtaU1.Bin034]